MEPVADGLGVEEHGLGDLEHDAPRVDPGAGEDGGHGGDGGRIEHLPGGEVHARSARCGQVAACSQARSSTHQPIGTMAPVSSAKRHERLRAEQAPLRVLPAHEGLVALDRQRGEVDDRLEVHDHLAGLDRGLHVGHQLEAVDGGRPHAVLEELDAGLAVGLGGVHGEVGVLQHALARLVDAAGQPEAGADAEVAAGQRERHVEGGQHPLGDQRALAGGGVALDEDGELVAADARHGVAEAHARPQPLADRRRAGGRRRRGRGCRSRS